MSRISSGEFGLTSSSRSSSSRASSDDDDDNDAESELQDSKQGQQQRFQSMSYISSTSPSSLTSSSRSTYEEPAEGKSPRHHDDNNHHHHHHHHHSQQQQQQHCPPAAVYSPRLKLSWNNQPFEPLIIPHKLAVDASVAPAFHQISTSQAHNLPSWPKFASLFHTPQDTGGLLPLSIDDGQANSSCDPPLPMPPPVNNEQYLSAFLSPAVILEVAIKQPIQLPNAGARSTIHSAEAAARDVISPLQRSVPAVASLELLASAASHLAERQAVADVIESVVASLETTTWTRYVTELQDIASDMMGEIATRSETFARESKQLHDVMSAAAQMEQQISHETALAKEKVCTMKEETVKLETMGAEITKRRDALTEKKDLSLLKPTILVRIVSFLRRRDLAMCMLVCRRWNKLFDRSYLWKANMAVAVKAVIAKRQKQEEEKKAVRDLAESLPRTASITITDTQKKVKQLSKSEVYNTCLVQIQAQVHAAQSEREDLNSQAAADAMVKQHFAGRIAAERHKFGLALSEKTELDRKVAKLSQDNALIVAEVGELEREIAAQNSMQQQAQEKATVALKIIEHRIRMLRDMQTYQTMPGDGGGGGEGNEGARRMGSGIGIGDDLGQDGGLSNLPSSSASSSSSSFSTSSSSSLQMSHSNFIDSNGEYSTTRPRGTSVLNGTSAGGALDDEAVSGGAQGSEIETASRASSGSAGGGSGPQQQQPQQQQQQQQSITIEGMINQMKTEKKLLIRVVKTLRSDVQNKTTRIDNLKALLQSRGLPIPELPSV